MHKQRLFGCNLWWNCLRSSACSFVICSCAL